MPDDSDATPTGLAHLSTFKPGRVVFLAVAGLLLLGGAVLTAHLMQPAWLAARSDLYRIKVSQAAATFQRAPAGTEQLASAIAQMTQALQAGFSELKQQQAGSGDAVKKIAQVTLELQDGVKQLKEQHQQLQGQVQQISKQQEQLQRQADNRTRQDAAAQAAGAETAKPSPAPAARAVVPDLTPFSEPVLPGVAKQVLELDKQQAGRRVISVSLFGTSERYIQGSLENAMLARRDWPGWTYRVYYGDGIPDGVLTILKAFGTELVRVDMKQERSTSTLWRYLPVADPTVTRFVARDIDARLSHRDKAAVDEWVASGLYFHTMHDAPQHTEPIMGGMWGAVGGFLNPKFILPLITNSTGAAWGVDQDWLKVKLWPHVQNYTLDHNAYLCGQLHAAEEKGFPTQREGPHDMVGNVHNPPSYLGYTHGGPCPERCRRDPKWEAC